MRRAAILGAIALLGTLYLADLSGMGMIGPDEPRYAYIGRAMAQSGDWITPRLWGQPWFEKPPLLYWMTAAGFRIGLGPDLAPRLPVALTSLAFLAFLFDRLRRLWNMRVASYSTAILATTAGWLAYSHVAVTDLPLATLFSAAVLLVCDEGEATPAHITAAAACLGLATLAKSLVPLVLFVPVWLLDYRRLRFWLRPAPLAAFTLIAVPWHVLCALRNGRQFLRILFVEHQFGRFTSPALQHGQRWWFYLPVFLLLLYPWFPLLAWADYDIRDRRVRTLTGVLVWGVVFFSLSVNKLPGYLLPLFPSACILIGLGLSRTRRPERALILPLALLGILPLAVRIAPSAVANGLRSMQIPWSGAAVWILAAAAIGLALSLLRRKAAAAAIAVTAGAWLWFQIAAFPSFDAAASARPLWRATQPGCAPRISRTLLYGLYYYAARPLPDCAVLDQPAARSVR